MRWFFMIVLVSCYPSRGAAACKYGCLDTNKLLELEKQLEIISNEVKTLRKNSEDSVCNSTWVSVYENDARGHQISGSLNDLINDIQAGASVRVLLDDMLFHVDFAHVIQNHVHVQLLQSVARETWNTFKKDGEWEWTIVSSNGQRQKVRYDVGASTFKGEKNDKAGVKWFTKKQSCYDKPELSHDKDGVVISGSLSALMTSIQEGKDIHCSSSNGSLAFPVQSVDMTKSIVSGQNVDHVSTQYDPYKNALVFQNNAYWWFTVHSTRGTRDMSRWTVGEHTSRGHTQSRVNVDWFVDPCWKRVLTHDMHGVAKFGSRADLVTAIKNGARVRVQVPAYHTAEADNLSIRNGHVTAQILQRLNEKNITRLADNASWLWRMISTTGRVVWTEYKVGEHKHLSTISISTPTSVYQEIHWFVDTKPWTLVYSHDAQGKPLAGNEKNVAIAVQSGAAFRGYYESSPNNGYGFSFQNLRIHGNHVSGQHLNHVSMGALSSQYEMDIKPNAYWWFVIYTTEGRMEMSRWNVGEHISRGQNVINQGLKWFANY